MNDYNIPDSIVWSACIVSVCVLLYWMFALACWILQAPAVQ